MDFLREQLRELYGNQVACYSGRGGETLARRAMDRGAQGSDQNPISGGGHQDSALY